MAARKAGSLAFEGLVKPLILRTNCSEAARISSSVTGGSKLKRILIFRHIFENLGTLNKMAILRARARFFQRDPKRPGGRACRRRVRGGRLLPWLFPAGPRRDRCLR